MGLKLEILEDYASLHLKMWTPFTAAGFPFCRTSRAYSPQEDSIKMSDADEKNGSIGVSWWEMVPVSDGRGKDGDGR